MFTVVVLLIFLVGAGVALWWIFKGNNSVATGNQNASLQAEATKSGNTTAQPAAGSPGDINSTANKNSINAIAINQNRANANASAKPTNSSGGLPMVDDTPPDVPPPPLTPFTGSLSV